MTRASRSRRPTPTPADAIDLSDDLDLFDYAVEPVPRKPQAKSGKRRFNPIVTDDWPEIVPITKAELDIFELYFADFFDEILSPKSQDGLASAAIVVETDTYGGLRAESSQNREDARVVRPPLAPARDIACSQPGSETPKHTGGSDNVGRFQ